MSNLLPFLIMPALAAAKFREETAGDEDRLEPRKIEAGPYALQYALPLRVTTDPAHEAHYDAFAVLTQVALDADIAFPVPPEDE